MAWNAFPLFWEKTSHTNLVPKNQTFQFLAASLSLYAYNRNVAQYTHYNGSLTEKNTNDAFLLNCIKSEVRKKSLKKKELLNYMKMLFGNASLIQMSGLSQTLFQGNSWNIKRRECRKRRFEREKKWVKKWTEYKRTKRRKEKRDGRGLKGNTGMLESESWKIKVKVAKWKL